ncbi:hypothetical protein SOP94_17190 [Peribacillus frigoritolerans]|uniref:hypothetical protein n=1 Tax=Peribacillus frigoritolerans TaxID=450367 RepID=UPI002B248B82|nr:hypothetical protein [Peribacillus frigoritolerans]MEB2630193.1 hypothetical protein [Peribacillus frigoritolerans]
MDTYSFDISSEFGYFQWSKTKGDNRITNLFISKTDVLGILGAIIGLDGYAQEYFREKNKSEKKAVFYNSLKGLQISIVPKREPFLFEDHLIHRHLNHVNKKGSLMVKIFGLIKPSYKVFIQQGNVSRDVFGKLVKYLSKGWAEFIPYAGKNNFPIEISSFQKEHLQSLSEQEMVVDSLFLEESLMKDVQVFEVQLKMQEGVFHYVESLKFFDEEVDTPQIVNRNMVWSSSEVSLYGDIYRNGSGETIVFY